MNKDQKAVNQTAGTVEIANGTDPGIQDSGTVESMILGVMYFDVIDPQTGRFIGPDNPNYFALKNQFGGDAGTVDPYKSKTCAPIIEEWRKKQAEKH